MLPPQFVAQREKLHTYFRRHGLEGDAAFQALAYHYVIVRADSLDIPGAVTQRWQAAHDKISSDGRLVAFLDELVRQDGDGADLPEWYQFLVGRRFREGSGKFFTPKPVAAAMTRLLPLREGAVIMDPTCGGGTFLIEAGRRWRGRECTLVANDVERSLVELALLSLSLGAPECRRVFSAANIYDSSQRLTKWHGGVDYVLANPPFSLRIEHEQLDSPLFSLGYRNSDALFIDLAFRLLRPGGRLVCLLPHSLIVNRDYADFRQSVEQRWTLAGVIGLPEGVFHLNAGTTARADIVILDKKPSEAEARPALFASVPCVGVRLNGGAKTPTSNDLETLLDSTEVRTALGTSGGDHG